jgi:hypothetical protein
MVPAGAKYCPSCGTVVASATAYDAGYDPKHGRPGGAQPLGAYDPILERSPYAAGQNIRSYGPMAPGSSGLAVASMVFGILEWCGLPFVGAILAVVMGHMARREIRESGGRLTGEGMATVGLVSGYVQLALVAAVMLIGAVIVVGGIVAGSR